MMPQFIHMVMRLLPDTTPSYEQNP